MPKPGPVTPEVSQSARAQYHAREASRLLIQAGDVLNDDANATSDELVELASVAQAHALVSLAWSATAGDRAQRPGRRHQPRCSQEPAK